MDSIEFEVINWEKFNPRKDVKHPTWFALSNRVLEDPKFFGLSGDQFKAVIYLFSQASQKGSSKAVVFLDHAEQICKITPETMRSTLELLIKRGVVACALPKTKARTRTSRPRTQTSRDTTDRQTDKTDTTLAVRTDTPVVEENPVRVYCDEYKARYNHSPVIGPKQAGILTRFAKSHPRKWPELIRGYLQLPDTFLVQRSHPTELLESKLNEIERFLKTGKVVTRKVVDDIEKKIDKTQGTGKRRSLTELVPDDGPLKLTGGES